MTLENLLVADNMLEGPSVVTVRVRPLRVAYIVPDDDIRVATRVVESCCLTWGGAGYFIIPYSRYIAPEHVADEAKTARSTTRRPTSSSAGGCPE